MIFLDKGLVIDAVFSQHVISIHFHEKSASVFMAFGGDEKDALDIKLLYVHIFVQHSSQLMASLYNRLILPLHCQSFFLAAESSASPCRRSDALRKRPRSRKMPACSSGNELYLDSPVRKRCLRCSLGWKLSERQKHG